MSAFTSLVDRLASPPWLFTLAFLLFLAGRRSRLVRSRAAGLVIGTLAAAGLGAGLADAGLRRLILDPGRLPVAVLLLATAAVLWTSLDRRVREAPRPGVSRADAVAATLAGLAVVLCALAYETPLGPVADPASKPEPAKAPWFLSGLQEMRLYFDPWAADLALPLLFLAGLLVLPYLESAAIRGERRAAAVRRDAVTLFLFVWLFLWLLPIAVATFLRGPHWHAFGPFEAWDSSRPAPPPALNLAEAVWIRWLKTGPPEPWWLRELPGVVLLGGYFVLLPLTLLRSKATQGLFDAYRQALGRWRFHAAMALVLALWLVPLKMYGRWLLDVGYWIHLPELGFRF